MLMTSYGRNRYLDNNSLSDRFAAIKKEIDIQFLTNVMFVVSVVCLVSLMTGLIARQCTII